jgi:hypothetical protein
METMTMPTKKRTPVPVVRPRAHKPVAKTQPTWTEPALQVPRRVLTWLKEEATGPAAHWYRQSVEPTKDFADGGKYAPITSSQVDDLLDSVGSFIAAAEDGTTENPRADLTSARAFEARVRKMAAAHDAEVRKAAQS